MKRPRGRSGWLVLVLLVLAGETWAQDIVNPLIDYVPLPGIPGQTEPGDSVPVMSVEFVPLPKFDQVTTAVVTFTPFFRIESDIEVAVQGDFVALLVAPPVALYPGPIDSGQEIRFQFAVRPRAVGFHDLSFIAYNPKNKGTATPVWVGGYVRTNLLLGPTGETLALGSKAACGNYATVLGPMPDLLHLGFVVAKHPMLPRQFRPPDYEDYLTTVKGELCVFDARLEISSGDRRSLSIHSTVSPYLPFSSGIAVEVQHGPGVKTATVSPSVVGPVEQFGSYTFDVELEFGENAEVELLRINFLSSNPNYNPDASGVRKKAVSAAAIPLYVGFDDAGGIAFVVNRIYWDAIERQQKQDIPALFRDSRVELAERLKHPERPQLKVLSEGFEAVLPGYGEE